MKFVNEAARIAPTLPAGSTMRLALEYLLAHGRGRANAQPWRNIQAHLRANGIAMSQPAFQQTVLRGTRSNNIFIGSNDHGPTRGYFLIEDDQDAQIMRDWYQNRINKEVTNLQHLDALIGLPWP
jgi:hypothetical protein